MSDAANVQATIDAIAHLQRHGAARPVDIAHAVRKLTRARSPASSAYNTPAAAMTILLALRWVLR
jgi:hypothetical protein